MKFSLEALAAAKTVPTWKREVLLPYIKRSKNGLKATMMMMIGGAV